MRMHCCMQQYQRECQILRGCISSLLPSVGNFVQKIVLSNSLALDDRMVCIVLCLQTKLQNTCEDARVVFLSNYLKLLHFVLLQLFLYF